MTTKTPKPACTVDGVELYAVAGIPGIYVTADGRDVYQKRSADDPRGATKKPERLSTGTNAHGYKYAVMNKKPVAVHPLICRAFHGEPPSRRHVAARVNADKTDNRPENLRWMTRGESTRAAFERRNPPTKRQMKIAAQRHTTHTPPDRVRMEPGGLWERAMNDLDRACREAGIANPLDGGMPDSRDFDEL